MKSTSYFLLSLFLFLFLSCKKENASINLLRKAQEIVDNDPTKALVFLDSIRMPENMDKDNYMQYIVTHAQAKQTLQQRIIGDSLIFEAQEYFNSKNNAKHAALANYYAGIANREINRYDKSLISFLKSEDYAKKIKDNKLSGKIFEYIAYGYLEQGLMDSAVVNYKKAANYYNIEKNAPYVLRVTNQIGRAYEDMEKLDSAYIYFNNTLQIAEELNDEQNKSNLTQNLGLTCFGMGDYDKAIEYYKSALDMQVTSETQERQIYLYLLKIYTNKQDINTAKEYAAKVETCLPEVTFIHTKRGMYEALSNYYKLIGDYKQALHFKDLESETKDQIAKEERPAEMIKADTKFRIEQKDKHYNQILSDFYLYLWVGIIFIIAASGCVLLVWKQNKKDKNVLHLQKEKYNRFRERLQEMNSNYPQIEAEIKAMLEDKE